MSAWKKLLADPDWCRGKGRFPLPAYSEYLPPPFVGVKPSGHPCGLPDPRADGFGWNVGEYEEEQEIWPGLERVARVVLDECRRLANGERLRHIARARLRRNPAWPAALAARAGKLFHERFTLLLPVALSRTQDDKGRVRWTLFGGSEQGPGKPFWRGFFTAPGEEAPWGLAEAFFVELLSRGYGVPEAVARDPGAAGLRVLPMGRDPDFPYWAETLPSWAADLRYKRIGGVRYLLTFRPFERLPDEVQDAYLDGHLHLLPFPGSLIFWHMAAVRKLQKQLPFAMQIPLLSLFERAADPGSLRIPQSGWFHESAVPADDAPDARRETVARPHRWQRVGRDGDDKPPSLDAPLAKALFSTDADFLGLYNKPLARQAQVWTEDHRLVLDGTRHGRVRRGRAEEQIEAGGRFGYRFIYPAMRAGAYEVYWHLPVAAVATGSAAPTLLLNGPSGYLTAYRAAAPGLSRPVELWPRFLDRPEHQAAVELFRHEGGRGATTRGVRALLEWHEMLGRPLPHSLAWALLDAPNRMTLRQWLDGLPTRASDPVGGAALADRLRARLEDAADAEPPADEGLTFGRTATREFESAYWDAIVTLAHGRFHNKCTGDLVRDRPTREALVGRRRDLDAVRRHLLRHHAAVLEGVPEAWVGEQQFAWRTEFDYPWMGGWRRNQEGPREERNVIVRIPGKDASRAVILADHYDTAYMHDVFDRCEGGTGARLAANGADDNASATALLMLASPILLDLSRAGRLACDVWLVHLTGEEFPADCLGARLLTQHLVQRTLRVKPPGAAAINLSGVSVEAVIVADMIAHDTPRERRLFQLSPGENAASARLAAVALEATRGWNALARQRNRSGERRRAGPYQRTSDPGAVPALAAHAVLRPEVRPDWSPRSTLFNTDGQIFSDAGFPTLLFMEDYDIGRVGYHDTKDTVALIDLDYGAALAAVVLETAARVAVASPG